jgi:hypothetical protein
MGTDGSDLSAALADLIPARLARGAFGGSQELSASRAPLGRDLSTGRGLLLPIHPIVDTLARGNSGMPNGVDKNWVRLRAAIAGFYLRHARWPDRVRVRPAVIANLRSVLFSEDAFSKLVARTALVADEQGTFIAEDESGHYDYGREGFAPGWSGVDVAGWLGVEPDRHGG